MRDIKNVNWNILEETNQKIEALKKRFPYLRSQAQVVDFAIDRLYRETQPVNIPLMGTIEGDGAMMLNEQGRKLIGGE